VLFANIRLQNALSQTAQIRHVDAVVMNPPFCKWQAPKSVSWASGSINSSALFTERVFGEMSPASKLVAVLPDVLRSGARYQKWRELMLSMGRVEHVVPLDQFDASTDVHVFILVMTRTQSSADPRNTRAFFGQRATASRKGYISEKGASQIRDLFNVSVGPVVDYREPRKGNWFPFLVARDVPAWESLLTGFPKRRFRGTTVRAPFVVVRRTSRPEDRFRAVGTIIRGRDRYAVENHLITIQPKDGKLKTCQLLLDVLKRQETSDYLNQAIRCRHLTVSAVKSIPWESIVG
jgi:hypothetical protein